VQNISSIGIHDLTLTPDFEGVKSRYTGDIRNNLELNPNWQASLITVNNVGDWEIGAIKNVLGANYNPQSELFMVNKIKAGDKISFTYDINVKAGLDETKLMSKIIAVALKTNLSPGLDKLERIGLGKGDKTYLKAGEEEVAESLNVSGLSIKKESDKQNVNPGDTVEITIWVENNSGKILHNFELYEDYDQTYLSPLNIRIGTDDGSGIKWTRAVLEDGQKLEFRYKATVKAAASPNQEFGTVSSVYVDELDTSTLKPKISFKVRAVDQKPISEVHQGIVLAQTGQSFPSFLMLMGGVIGLASLEMGRKKKKSDVRV
jgi:plastocyanin